MKTILVKQGGKALTQRGGITLVSLMIGMALSTFLIAAILQIFISVKNNYKLEQNIAEINDTMRFAVTRLSQVFSYTGYRYPTAIGLPTFDHLFGLFVSPPPYYHIYGVTNNSATIFFQSDGYSIGADCLGNIAPSAYVTEIRFSAGGSNLTCVSVIHPVVINAVTNDVEPTATATSNNVVLVPDLLANIWIKHGNDISNTGAINGYVDPQTNWSANFRRIRAVRIALLLKSRDPVLPQDTTKTFNVFGNSQNFGPDKYIYKLHVFTVPFAQLPVPLP